MFGLVGTCGAETSCDSGAEGGARAVEGRWCYQEGGRGAEGEASEEGMRGVDRYILYKPAPGGV